jgi:hypothetical protein
VRRLRPRLHHRAIIQAVFELAHRTARWQDERHRLLVEDAGLFRQPVARLQLGARPHAVGRHRRERGQPDLYYIGVSGDGDSLSIGMGQFAHVIRRNLNMLYIIENNGVYGLTKGQFSASADVGSKAKKGEPTSRCRSIRSAPRSASAPPSSPAASPATSSSWCR